MARKYKVLKTCRMCKKRYVFKRKKAKKISYMLKHYCKSCYDKYIKNHKKDQKKKEKVVK